MNITRGKIQTAQKVVVYGPEGIGKSTFAASFPEALFSDTEDSTRDLDVARFDKPESFQALLDQAKYVRDNPGICKTYAVDTADWAEKLAFRTVCDRAKKTNIEDFGYGKGYVYGNEEFGKLLNILSEIVDRGINVVVTAHAMMRKFEQPDEFGSYDRWELKLHKLNSSMLKEWADMVLFANYETFLISSDNDSKKMKAQGGKRVMHTTHNPCWDAKNRKGLADKLDFSFKEIAHCFNFDKSSADAAPEVKPQDAEIKTEAPKEAPKAPPQKRSVYFRLAQLMTENGVTDKEIQMAVGSRGYFPEDMRIMDYPEEFVSGCLIGCWEQVFGLIKNMRENAF